MSNYEKAYDKNLKVVKELVEKEGEEMRLEAPRVSKRYWTAVMAMNGLLSALVLRR